MTDKEIKALKFTGKQQSYLVGNSLYIMIGSKTKSWFIRYMLDGKRRKMNLGKYPAMSLKQARERANEKIVEVKKGRDVAKTRRDYRDAPTMSDLWEEYQKALGRKKKQKAPSTTAEELRKWNKLIGPALGTMKVSDVGRPEIIGFLNGIADTVPVMANRTQSLLVMILDTALNLDWLTTHPMYRLKSVGGAEESRKRVLSDGEIQALWQAFDQVNPNARDMFKLGLLTAQRPGEIASMRWSDIDLDEQLWTMAENKTSSVNLVPLSAQAMEILRNRNRETDYVFPSMASKRCKYPYSSCTRPSRLKLTKITGIENWTAHDLRRTARTIMPRLGIKPHIAERCLNHKQQGVAGVYDRYSYLQEKTVALQKLGNEIDRINGVKTAAKVIKLNVAV